MSVMIIKKKRNRRNKHMQLNPFLIGIILLFISASITDFIHKNYVRGWTMLLSAALNFVFLWVK